MKLIATPEEIQKFTKLGVLKIKSKDSYFIETNADLKGIKHEIEVEMNTEPTNKPSNKVLEYDKYWRAFPTPSEIRIILKGIGVRDTRNLRTGSRETTQKRLIKLSKSYSPQEILDTIKYEVSLRTKESLATGKNKFEFMKAAEAWANDEGNISVMYEEMKNPLGKKVGSSNSNYNNSDDDFNFV